MGMKYAGWLFGMVTLFLCAAVTAYTAKLLAKCMDLDPSLITFSDLAFISFGRNARIATSILFTLELLAACVALIVLFADSLHLLFPGFLGVTEWKVVCALIMIPLNFLPLRLLSFTSIIGIFSCFSSKYSRKMDFGNNMDDYLTLLLSQLFSFCSWTASSSPRLRALSSTLPKPICSLRTGLRCHSRLVC